MLGPSSVARRVLWPVCAAALLIGVTCPGLTAFSWAQWLPWVLGLAIFGLPHGALDHRVVRELEGPVGRVVSPGFFAVYLAAAVGVLAVWWLAPTAALIGFLIVAGIHFGQGDVYWSRRFGLLAARPSRGYGAVLLLVRGLLPVALPALAFANEYVGLARAMAGHFSPGAMDWTFPPELAVAGVRAAWGLVVVQSLWAMTLTWFGNRRSRLAAAEEVAESTLLAALMTCLPPVLAVGLYFNAWHAPRHVARLMLIAAPTRPLVASGQWVNAFVAFVRLSWPITLAALAGLAVLTLLTRRTMLSIADLGLMALVFISALTLPHALVVSWMDHRQGVWRMQTEVGP